MYRKLVLLICVLLFALAGALATPVRAQAVSCGNFGSVGELAGGPGFPVVYTVFSGGGTYDFVLTWGDGNETSGTVVPTHTRANPLELDNLYQQPGRHEMFISTSGFLSPDGTNPCSDVSVPIGAVTVRAPATSCAEYERFAGGVLTLDSGDNVSYELEAGNFPINAATIDWGDGTTESLPGPLGPGRSRSFPHAYRRPGTYDVFVLAVTGGDEFQPCADSRVSIGTVVVREPPRRPLAPRVAQRKCDDFLRKAKGRVGRIIRQASGKPVTTCKRAKGTNRTCKTTVVVRKRCRCRYTITTRVPARGKVKVTRIAKQPLPGGGGPRGSRSGAGTV